jgi:hypothetical protein
MMICDLLRGISIGGVLLNLGSHGLILLTIQSLLLGGTIYYAHALHVGKPIRLLWVYVLPWMWIITTGLTIKNLIFIIGEM